MEIHFHDSEITIPDTVMPYFGWVDTIRAVNRKESQIHTTQMGLLQTALFEHGYRIFVHPYDDEHYEIKLGSNDCTDREIRMEHNLFNLWKAGEFSL